MKYQKSLASFPLFILCFLMQTFCLDAQETPFEKGVNLASWFQTSSVRQVQFSKYTRTDFEQIKSLGGDVVRIPVDLHGMTSGAPDYVPDPLFLRFFDEIIDWAEALEMYVILDNHTFDPSGSTVPAIEEILNKVWPQMAAHFKDRSEFLIYEIKNEPNGINESTWNAIQGRIIEAIRAVDDKHTIMVGAANWNSFHSLEGMPEYEDDNLIYTFHFYDPFVFTHQGASWVNPTMEPLVGVPFPYDADKMPALPSVLNNTWVGSNFNSYSQDGTAEKVKELIDIAVRFREERNVPIYCGEFGVYIPNSENEDRVRWYQVVSDYLDENNISWTTWDYIGGFGIFEAGGSLFDHDLNIPLLEALGFNTPPQTEFIAKPDSVGFPLYTDFIAAKISESSFGSANLNYYSDNQPSEGDYIMHWTGASRYSGIGLTFQPRKDLTYLVEQDYALELMVRTDDSNGQLDIRFIDSKLGPTERPWRIRTTLNGSDLANGEWNRVYIPLKNFQEHGSWDNNMWFNPEGKFDWADIDKLEIVAEYGDMGGANWWFDQVRVVNENISTSIHQTPTLPFKVYPNPTTNMVVISGLELADYTYQMVDVYGKIIQTGLLPSKGQLDLTHLKKGMYWLYLKNEVGEFGVEKVVKF